MATVERERLVPPEMTPEQLEMLSAAERMLMEALDRSRAATITVESDDGDVPPIAVPAQVLRVLAKTLGMMARGQTITLVHEQQELSTVEAANFLNVSRPFIIKEIQHGRAVQRSGRLRQEDARGPAVGARPDGGQRA